MRLNCAGLVNVRDRFRVAKSSSLLERNPPKHLMASERTVGAALRGRPWLQGIQEPAISVLRTRFKPRAATEGRPYSTVPEAIAAFEPWPDQYRTH